MADGYEIGTLKPTRVSERDLKGADQDCVPLGTDLKPWLPNGGTAADWSATPSVNADYQAAQECIKKHLEILIQDHKK